MGVVACVEGQLEAKHFWTTIEVALLPAPLVWCVASLDVVIDLPEWHRLVIILDQSGLLRFEIYDALLRMSSFLEVAGDASRVVFGRVFTFQNRICGSHGTGSGPQRTRVECQFGIRSGALLPRYR